VTSIPADLKFTAEHEWLRSEDGNVRVGITEFAQDQLGDIVYVELPPVGQKLASGKAFGVVESVKAASDLYSPLSGTVVEANEALLDEPELVNSDPYGEGWMLLVEPAGDDAVELFDAEAYEKLLAEEE
jgi:glycine cleavage system H protein